MKRFCRRLTPFVLLAGFSPAVAHTDVFLLQNDGQVRGELANRDESPRKTYVIKTAGGGQVTLDAAQVKEVKKQSAAEVKYDQTRTTSRTQSTDNGSWPNGAAKTNSANSGKRISNELSSWIPITPQRTMLSAIAKSTGAGSPKTS